MIHLNKGMSDLVKEPLNHILLAVKLYGKQSENNWAPKPEDRPLVCSLLFA